MNLKDIKISIIGLGYVGLPLALEFAKHFPVVGFDISAQRISDLKAQNDFTKEAEPDEIAANLKKSLSLSEPGFFPTSNEQDMAGCNVFIVTVPTPVDTFKKPDLQFLIDACKTVGKYLKKGGTVIFESTTFPGCTEEICVPLLEETSGLKFNSGFFVGYSPERISPGDKKNRLPNIVKVTSGSTPETADFVDELYQKIIKAGTFKASSIKIAEASKAVENAQRDINISFINELAIIFEKLGIDTNDVLEAASTKWNFLKFQPGLVGGHCIDVDPYYLAYKSEQAGYQPDVILSGRRINDGMGKFVAGKVVKMMVAKDIPVKNSRILILGFTFKENCPDFRNTKIVDIYNELIEFGSSVMIFDPWADSSDVKKAYGIEIINDIALVNEKFDAIILAVAHDSFKEIDILKLKKENSVVYDCKGVLNREIVDARL